MITQNMYIYIYINESVTLNFVGPRDEMAILLDDQKKKSRSDLLRGLALLYFQLETFSARGNEDLFSFYHCFYYIYIQSEVRAMFFRHTNRVGGKQ